MGLISLLSNFLYYNKSRDYIYFSLCVHICLTMAGTKIGTTAGGCIWSRQTGALVPITWGTIKWNSEWVSEQPKAQMHIYRRSYNARSMYMHICSIIMNYSHARRR